MRRLVLVLLFAPGVAAAQTLAGRVASVIDGDTLAIVGAENQRRVVRLAEIDAPEKGQPFHVESARSLASTCLGKTANVAVNVTQKSGRVIGKVSCEGVDAGSQQVRRGMAWARAGHVLPNSPVYEAEAFARLQRVGLWAGEKPVPPWEWRKQQRATQ